MQDVTLDKLEVHSSPLVVVTTTPSSCMHSSSVAPKFPVQYHEFIYPGSDHDSEVTKYPPPPPIPPVVPNSSIVAQTCQGPVSGCDHDGTALFLGIPYAAPPVGDLRFRKAVMPPKRNETYAATSWSKAWPQPKWGITDCETPHGTSEDCLYMNIWCPRNPAASMCPVETLVPVYVYCHGGAFTTGTACAYAAHEMCKENDMIVVHFNYRMGFPGFSNLRDVMEFDESEGFEPNLGMWDQIHALRWVHENIRYFGGDPNCVTIAGESAGATAVALLLIAEPAKPYFHRAIPQSGGLSMVLSKQKVTEATEAFLKLIGLWVEPQDRTPELLKQLARELRQYPEESIVHAWSKLEKRDFCPFGPCFDGDLFPSSLSSVWQEATTNTCPLLIGTTKDECTIFTECWENCKTACVPVATNDLHRLLNQYHGHRVQDFERFYGLKQCQETGRMYSCPKGAPGNPNAQHWIKEVNPGLASDYHFHIPAKNLADQHSKHSPCYRYRLDWPSPDQNGRLGAYHAYELGVIFEFTAPLERARGVFRVRNHCQEWGRRLRQIWGHFARYGKFDPQFLEWPLYNTKDRPVMTLNDKKEVVIHDPEGPERRDLWEDKEFYVHD